MEIRGEDFISNGFDKSERCYQLENKNSKAKKLEFKLAGSAENPICNPAFFIKNWNGDKAAVLVNGKPAKDARIGINHKLDGDDLWFSCFLKIMSRFR